MTNKYLRTLQPNGAGQYDVYSVLVGFGVTCPARGHAVKKLLLAGQRGVKSELQDLHEARTAINRAIQIYETGTQGSGPAGTAET